MTNRAFAPYLEIIRWHKPIGSLLLLWPTLMALWLAAKSKPSLSLLVIFTLGVFVMRSAGCVVNDFADRHIDGHVQRTQGRPLVNGRLSVAQALVWFLMLIMVAFVLVSLTNLTTVLLSVVALLLAVLYPFTKRFFAMPQLILGAAFGWAIPMAYAAQSQPLSLDCWILFVAAVLWTIAYDTVYAMVDKEDDQKIGVLSSARLMKTFDITFVALCETAMMVGFLLIGWLHQMNTEYYLGCGIAIGYFIYLQSQIKERCPKKCFNAFLNHHWVGLILFVSVILGLRS